MISSCSQPHFLHPIQLKRCGSHPQALRTAPRNGSHRMTHRQAALCWFSVGFSEHSGNCSSFSANKIFLPPLSPPLTGTSSVKLLVIKTKVRQGFFPRLSSPIHPESNTDSICSSVSINLPFRVLLRSTPIPHMLHGGQVPSSC